jgi:hypothetical protein
VLSRHGPQPEQTLLDLLQPRRIEFQRIARRLELGLRLGRLAQGPVERGQRRIEMTGSLVDVAFDQAMRRAERGDRAPALLQFGQRLRHRLTERAAGTQQLPLRRQRLLIVGLGRQSLEFLHGMAQEVLVAPRRRRGGLGLGARLLGRAPGPPRRANGFGLLLEASEGGEARCVATSSRPCCSICPWISTSVSPSRRKRDRRRLIVDEGAAPAVGADHAAQRQDVLVTQALFSQDRVRRMGFGQVEGGGDRGLRGAAPYGGGIGARAQGGPSASIRMDLPAPVSPVSAPSPPLRERTKSRSSFSISTKSRIESETSMQDQNRPKNQPLFSSGGRVPSPVIRK